MSGSLGRPPTVRKEDIDELFTDLKVLGTIKQHQKLYTNGHQIRIDGESIFQPASRFVFGENRAGNMRSIKRVLQQANTVVDLYMHHDTPNAASYSIVRRLKNEMENAILGLGNLKTTYDSDMTTMSAITVLIENIHETVHSIGLWLSTQQPHFSPAAAPAAVAAAAPAAVAAAAPAAVAAAAPAAAAAPSVSPAHAQTPTPFDFGYDDEQE
jgi:hypothetical protein